MKVIVNRLALLCLATVVGTPMLAHATCTGGGRLKGGYSLLVAGNSLSSNKGKYLSGALQFDGKCGFTGASISGGIDGVVSTVSVTGTYAINADSTISLAMAPSDGSVVQTYIVGYSVTQHKAVGIEMDGTATATIDLQEQQSQPNSYTLASLAGTYASTCNGLASSKDDLNYFTFDGAGHLEGANPYDRKGNIGNAHVTGQYTVNPDGTFAGSLNGSFSVFSFTGALSKKSTEIQYIYAQTGVGEIVACTGWR